MSSWWFQPIPTIIVIIIANRVDIWTLSKHVYIKIVRRTNQKSISGWCFICLLHCCWSASKDPRASAHMKSDRSIWNCMKILPKLPRFMYCNSCKTILWLIPHHVSMNQWPPCGRKYLRESNYTYINSCTSIYHLLTMTSGLAMFPCFYLRSSVIGCDLLRSCATPQLVQVVQVVITTNKERERERDLGKFS